VISVVEKACEVTIYLKEVGYMRKKSVICNVRPLGLFHYHYIKKNELSGTRTVPLRGDDIKM
jgi:hypothetical protein